ncbi:MAG: aromatic amino acid lyase [Thermoleophilia bacterium]|nr:aromatic amino acid lyase [Thermoleophilia bacterium]MDH5333705.1 aromatic amino acid lyase [Thermoleophilia bacterium]
MTVTLTGRDLTLTDVVRVARQGVPVELAPEALDRMAAARRVAEQVIASGTPAYGLTTGLGIRKSATIHDPGHDRLVLRQHLIAHPPYAPPDVVRATALRLANAFAQGTTVARPLLAEHLVTALNEDRLPQVRLRGSVGESDLASMADLAEGVLGDLELAQGEAIALLNQSSFASGWGALAVHDALGLLDALDVAGALDLEALGANHTLLHPAIGDVRPYPGVRATLERLGSLLTGSTVPQRALQDPLTFRALPQVNGAARDAFRFVGEQLAIELNCAQANPLVVVDERVVVSVGNFEMAPLATALDLARLALAPALTSACERAVKLLQPHLTDLPEGLAERSGLAESAYSELGIALQALTAEARLLAQPVSHEVVSASQAGGIEDRMTMAPLAARRLAEMTEIGTRIVAVELLLAAQACDLRGAGLGAGTARARDAVRSVAPFLREGDLLPDIEPLVELVRSGGIAAS